MSVSKITFVFFVLIKGLRVQVQFTTISTCSTCKKSGLRYWFLDLGKKLQFQHVLHVNICDEGLGF